MAAHVQSPPAVQNNQESHTSTTQLLRYFYTGTLTSSLLLINKDPDLQDIENTMACVINMATEDPAKPIGYIRKAYQDKSYIRVDEILIVLAYCAKQTHSEKLRTEANTEAINLITDPNDFLLFANYCIKISEILRGPHHVNFGHGMCRLVDKWYRKHSAVELANMFGERRKLHSISHQSIMNKSHFRTKEPDPIPDPNVAPGNNDATPSTSTSPATSPAEIATPQNNNPARLTPPTEDEDRKHVFQFNFYNQNQKYLEYLASEEPLGPGTNRLKEILKFKVNEDVASAIESMQRNNFSFGQMPSHLLEKKQVWEQMIPTMSTRTLLKHFNTMKDLGFFDDSEFVNHFIKATDKFNQSIVMEQICPVQVYILKELYKKNVRYLGTRKAEYYEKKITKRNIHVNTKIVANLDIVFHHALLKAKPTPAKFMIVIDPRTGNQKKAILRNRHINCFEASFLLAYSIYVREKDTLVYTYTEQVDKLNAVHNQWTKLDFDAAKRKFYGLAERKTKQSLAEPILKAIKSKKHVDMFLVIVDSVARFCRQGIVPVEEYKRYRNRFNNNAKFVVVNMARPEADLKIPQTEDMTGFFEINGINETTPKIINLLAQNIFD